MIIFVADDLGKLHGEYPAGMENLLIFVTDDLHTLHGECHIVIELV